MYSNKNNMTYNHNNDIDCIFLLFHKWCDHNDNNKNNNEQAV